jgi:phage-related protein
VSDALSRAYVEIEPDFSEFNRMVDTGLRRATRQIESRIRGALANVEDRFSNLGSQITNITGNAFGDMARDAEDAADDVTKALRDIGQEDVTIDVGVDVDGNEIRDEVRDKVRGVNVPRINIPIDVDSEGTFSRFLSSITGVRLPVAGFAALGTAAAAAGAAVVQFAAALAPAVGIVAGLPAAIGVGAAAIGTLQVATAGFGDAMAAAFDDTEAFNAAIENLSPNAQAAAEAFRAVVPELQAMQNIVQDAFFAEFDAAITNVAGTLIGPLSEGMRVAAAESGNLVAALLNVAGSESGVNFINSSFATLNATLAQLQAPVANLFTALLDLGTVVNTAFGGEEAGAGLAALIQQFADFIAQANASGESLAWVNNALTVFQQIGAILSPIVGIIGSIGSAAATTGGNILGVFGQALQVFDDFLASAQGQEVLVTLFEALNQVGASFGTVLANIAPALPPIISGISSILGVVTPLLGPLSELVGSVLSALAPILGVVAAAIQPLIAPLTTIITILGEILVGALESVMPLIEVLADLLGSQLAVVLEVVGAVLEAVAPIFTVLFEALQPIIEALTPLFELLGVVADIIGAVLGPIIQVLGDILLWLVEQVIVPFVVPVIEFLAELLTGALGAAVQWIVEQFQLAGDAMVIVWDLIKVGISSSIDAIIVIWDALSAAFKAGWNFIKTTTIDPMKNGLNALKVASVGIIASMRSAWDSFVGFMKGIPGKISGALSSMFSPLWSGFKSAINSVIGGWNNLSFSVPSVDLGPLGSVGGFTVSTPNIPMLQTGGFTTAQGLALLHPDEMVLPLSNSHGINALAAALEAAGAGGTGGAPIQVIVQIGSETITQMVDTRVTQSNKTLTRRARAGTGRN